MDYQTRLEYIRASEDGDITTMEKLFKDVAICDKLDGFDAAVKKNQYKSVKFSLEKGIRVWGSCYSMRTSDINILKLFKKYDFWINEITYFEVFRYADEKTFKWFIKNFKPLCTKSLFSKAIQSRNLKALQWLYDNNCDYDLSDFEFAKANGLKTSKWRKLF